MPYRENQAWQRPPINYKRYPPQPTIRIRRKNYKSYT